MTTISTTADLLRLLREDPDFRDEVRRLILSQELIDLPERFARFESYVERRFDSLESSMGQQFSEVRGEITGVRGEIAEVRGDITGVRGDITGVRGDIAEVRGDITGVRGDIAEVRGDITGVRGDIGRLKGAEYERKVSRVFASYASAAFRQRHSRPLRSNRLLVGAGQSPATAYEEILATAFDNGEITEEEIGELQQVDAVMMGQDQGSTVYFVGEFSVTVNDHDIDRAISRAAVLRRVTGSAAWPMVIGDTIPYPQRARAEAEGVEFRQVAE